MNPAEATVTLSLISHTNVGKTTLARTLLRREIGRVEDRAHVTDQNESHVMLEAPDGAVLKLWDTPGFGDSARLLEHLEGIPRPSGWMKEEVWKHFDNRAQWCNQQAIRNIREEADVVLYLINSSETPEEAPYVRMEMQILDWLTKPVIVLLNQTGPPRRPETESAEEQRWAAHLETHEVVKNVISLDAFARCWVQEDLLMASIEGVLPFARRKTFKPLWQLWRHNNLRVFQASLECLASQLASAGCDSQALPGISWFGRLQAVLPAMASPAALRQEKEASMKALADRLDESFRQSLEQLIRLHDLEGGAAREIARRMARDYSNEEPVHEGISAVIGGLVSGALGGLGADLLSGGLSFGGGVVLGGLMGALGAGTVARGMNLVRGERESRVRWSFPLFQNLVIAAILRYLAVAHFGRGRGHYQESEYPTFWKIEVERVVTERQKSLQSIWNLGKKPDRIAKVHRQLQGLLEDLLRGLLESFYPDVRPFR